MFCSQCGRQLPDTAKFCSFCGAKLDLEPSAAAQTLEVPVYDDAQDTTPESACPVEQSAQEEPSVSAAPSPDAEWTEAEQLQPYVLEEMGAAAVQEERPAVSRRKRWLLAVGGIVAVAAIVVGCLMIFCNPAARLERQLERDWCQSTVNAYGFSSLLLLEFDDGVMTVTQKSDYFETRQLGEYRYRVLDGTSFRLEGINVTYTVEFNDNQNAMTISPGMLQGGSEETWFNFES